jgi:D-serine deaminase-like pyridoxal phosphate-dependent protein
LKPVGVGTCAISIGDTPTCSLAEDFAGVDEIRPGNFVFYDLMQQGLGTCTTDDIAVAVACPVVGKYPERGQILVYGGGVHLSKESLLEPSGRRIFGYLTSATEESLGSVQRDAAVIALSQEHGLLQAGKVVLDRTRVGDLAFVLPVHSCLTCNQFAAYQLLDGSRVSRRQS